MVGWRWGTILERTWDGTSDWQGQAERAWKVDKISKMLPHPTQTTCAPPQFLQDSEENTLNMTHVVASVGQPPNAEFLPCGRKSHGNYQMTTCTKTAMFGDKVCESISEWYILLFQTRITTPKIKSPTTLSVSPIYHQLSLRKLHVELSDFSTKC